MKKVDLFDIDEHYLLNLFSEIQMFSYLSDNEKREVFKAAEIFQYDKGETIISEGDVNPYLYAVIDGVVHVCKMHEGKSKFISSIKSGDVFGEAGIFINMRRTADVVAGEKTQVLRLERQSLFRFFKLHSDAGVRMLMIMTYSLLNKLKDLHSELIVDKKSDVTVDDIEDLLSAKDK